MDPIPTPLPGLSLHHLTAMSLSPEELVAVAAAAKCQHVCLFTYMPDVVRNRYPVVDGTMAEGLARAFSDSGVSLYNLEVFPLGQDSDWDGMAAGLALGAKLGARHATAHVHEPDEGRAVVMLRRMSDLAGEHGLDLGLEFNSFSATASLSQAMHLIEAARRENLRLIIDMLHFIRSGGQAEQLAAVAELVSYMQLCDGPSEMAAENRWREAIGDRAIPGKGAFPLRDCIARLRGARVMEVEVPSRSAREAGISPLDHVIAAVNGTRAEIDAALRPA
jgi:sugar phosphate isomerase/epimerase